MMSARSGLSPGTLRRSSGVIAGEHVEDVLEIGARNARRVHRARGENSLPGEIDAREVRERAARADELRAAPVATRQVVANVRRATSRAQRLRRALASMPFAKNSSVRRIAPKGSEPSRSMTPSALSASSSEPPPMSTTTVRPTPMSKCATALRKLSRASSSPSSTRTLEAGRRADRARGTRARSPRRARRSSRRRRCARRRAAARASPCARSLRARARIDVVGQLAGRVESGARGAARPSFRRRPGSRLRRETSATICRIEFDPMSIAATRRCPGAIVRRDAAVLSRGSGRMPDTDYARGSGRIATPREPRRATRIYLSDL